MGKIERAAIGCGAALFVVQACGISARGERERPPDSVLPDATTPITDDAATIDASDASVGADATAPPCVTFANTIAPFQYEGEANGYTLGPNSVTLAISSGKAARLFHTFTAPAAYSRTSVDVHLGMTWSESWGLADSDYATLLQQFHGATRQSDVSSRLDVTMAQNVVELNSWATTPQTTYGLNGMRVPGPDTRFTVVTQWASGNGGRVTVNMNPPSNSVATWTLANIPTTKTGPTDKLTVVIGGSGVNTVPDVTLTVFDVCVTFDPL